MTDQEKLIIIEKLIPDASAIRLDMAFSILREIRRVCREASTLSSQHHETTK